MPPLTPKRTHRSPSWSTCGRHWCGPCRFVGPILEELSREHAGKLKVVKVNVDENPMTAQRFEAYSIPTMVVLQRGRPVDRIVGALPKGELTVRLSPFLLRQLAA